MEDTSTTIGIPQTTVVGPIQNRQPRRDEQGLPKKKKEKSRKQLLPKADKIIITGLVESDIELTGEHEDEPAGIGDLIDIMA